MNISFNPNDSMEQFHNNENVVHLVNLCLDYVGDELLDDILILIKISSLEKAEPYLNNIESKYSRVGKINLFHDLKKTFLEIYSDVHVANLRGGFLELLSSKVFKELFPVSKSSFDCKVVIDDWFSPKTVDIGMKCGLEGLVCECKISRSELDADIFNNLLLIREKSDDYFSLFIVTLEDERNLFLKLREIKINENIGDLVKINIVTRNNFPRFCTGSFEKYDDIKKSVFVKNLA